MNDRPVNAEAALGLGADSPPGRTWDVLFLLAGLALTWLLRPPFFTDWDSFDYTVAAINAHPSSLASGRFFFIGMHALAWRIGHGLLGLEASQAFDLFRGLTVVLGGLTTVAVFRAAWHLTRSSWASVLTGLIWLTAPQAIVYGGSIMTDIPAMLFFALAVSATELAARSGRPGRAAWLAAAGGALFAVTVNMREPMICFGLYFAGRMLLTPAMNWRRRLTGSAAFLAFFALLTATGIGLAAWRLGGLDAFGNQLSAYLIHMAEERREYPNRPLENARNALLFSCSVSIPAVAWLLPSAALGLWRGLTGRRDRVPPGTGGTPRWGPLGWLMLGNAAYLGSLLMNHDLNVNPRFALPLMTPVMVLNAAAIADAVRRRSTFWLGVMLATALGVMAAVSIATTWRVSGAFPPVPGQWPFTWALLALLGTLVAIGMAQSIRLAGERPRLASAGAAVVLVGLFMFLVGWPWLEYHFYRNSKWLLNFVTAITAPGALPEDAMLAPSAGTPAVQYLVNTGQRPGWVLPGLPYYCSRDELLRTAVETPGWIVIPSGWSWPDGRDEHGDPHAADRKLRLWELVEAYQQAGKPVYLFAGPSMWAPGPGRRAEWPEIREVQLERKIADDGPGEMCLVLTDAPDPDEPIYPLGFRRRMLEGEMRPEPIQRTGDGPCQE